ncbi:D-aminoacyl-tRNA deacylase isoform X1 [Rhipicephalus sanguineus]|nr:D-aminoacyl-tRNA deacylase isoform X1 [Rhipicephalus sanguineus]
MSASVWCGATGHQTTRPVRVRLPTMRAVIQRVRSAAVHVDGRVISSIGRGLCVLVGIHRDDTEDDIDYIVRKILNLKLFDDDAGKRWKLSARELQLEVLCVSQFTLYGTLKGNKPDFHLAMEGDHSKQFYERFLHKIRTEHKEDLVKDGQFGALMQVDIQNDGPVTLEIESSAFRKVVPLPQERGEPDGGAADDSVP